MEKIVVENIYSKSSTEPSKYREELHVEKYK